MPEVHGPALALCSPRRRVHATRNGHVLRGSGAQVATLASGSKSSDTATAIEDAAQDQTLSSDPLSPP